ncbi:MAG: CcmD family protein [Carboxydocellales bacterium]
MNYLFAAYTVIWTLIFGYSLWIGRKQKALENELILLKTVLAEKEYAYTGAVCGGSNGGTD